MRRIKLTQGKYTLVDDEDFEWLNQWKWYYLSIGYAARGKGKNFIYMHRLIINTPKNLYTDHINNDKLDNRRCNLRICTNSENQTNRGKYKRNKSGYKGVCWFKQTNKWQAQIRKNNKRFHLGYFQNKIDAAKAYNQKAIELHDNFVYLNRI